MADGKTPAVVFNKYFCSLFNVIPVINKSTSSANENEGCGDGTNEGNAVNGNTSE